MKKIILVLVFSVLAVAQVFAVGLAAISPDTIAVSSQVSAFTITFTPSAGTSWNLGKVSFTVPEAFNPEPLTITPYSGQVTAIFHSSATGNSAVPSSYIQTDGRAVTINSLSFQANEYLVITYGFYDGNQAYGVTGPFAAGDYPFNFSEAPYGTAFTLLAEQPVVSVNNLQLAKSTNASNAAAGSTITYTIAYKNLSAVHQLNSVSIWDTVPQYLKITGTNLPATVQNAGYISWDIGSLMYSAMGSVQVYCQVQTGIARSGSTVVNTASGFAKDMYANEFRTQAQASLITYGPVLNASVSAAPSGALTGQHITVIMAVYNSGNGPATAVMPDSESGNSGTASAQKITGPVPASVSSLAGGASTHFTWIYSALSAGTFSFTGAARGLESGLSIETLSVSSNQVAVLAPTPTNTAAITLTPAVTETDTPTPADTPVIIVPTDTPVVVVPTDTPVVIPDKVIGGNVYTDKNYIKQGSGDRILIYYEVPGPGKLEITIFNLSGEKIRYMTKEYGAKTAGYAEWDGKNDALKPAGKGIYFINVKMGKWHKIKKVVILK